MPDPISVKTTHNPDPGWSPEERRARHLIFRKRQEVETLTAQLERQKLRLSEAQIKVTEWQTRVQQTENQMGRSKTELAEAEMELEQLVATGSEVN